MGRKGIIIHHLLFVSEKDLFILNI